MKMMCSKELLPFMLDLGMVSIRQFYSLLTLKRSPGLAFWRSLIPLLMTLICSSAIRILLPLKLRLVNFYYLIFSPYPAISNYLLNFIDLCSHMLPSLNLDFCSFLEQSTNKINDHLSRTETIKYPHSIMEMV